MKTTSRAVVMLGPRSTELRELNVPSEAPSGGAVVRVLANGLCGSDYDLYSGQFAAATTPFPLVPGHEPVGEIITIDAVASEAWDVKQGDRVAIDPLISCGMCRECKNGREKFCSRSSAYSRTSLDDPPGLWGGMADYMVLRPRTRLNKVPENLSDIDATLFNPFGNAFEWVSRIGQVTVGDHVLILGCGQRGLACAAVAASAGAEEIIVTGLNRDAHKLALAQKFGASAQVNVQQEDMVLRVQELTNGNGVDVVIDTVPRATEPVLAAIDVLRPEGTLVLAGVKGQALNGLSTDQIFKKGLHIHGALATSPWATANAVRLLAKGDYPLESLHTHTVGLGEAEHAIRILGGEVDDERDAIHITVMP